jgi:hypothetical protein
MQYRRERVRLETQRHIIEGTLQLPNEGYRSRLTDFLNARDREFVALTDVDLKPVSGFGELENVDFLAVATRHVILAREMGSLGIFDATGPTPAEVTGS